MRKIEKKILIGCIKLWVIYELLLLIICEDLQGSKLAPMLKLILSK